MVEAVVISFQNISSQGLVTYKSDVHKSLTGELFGHENRTLPDRHTKACLVTVRLCCCII
jgi:hypothetical protein